MNDHPNQNASKGLAIATIVSIGLSYLVHVLWGKDIPLNLGLFFLGSILCVISAFINWVNTFETNKNWKTYLGAIAIIIMILIVVVPIAIKNGG